MIICNKTTLISIQFSRDDEAMHFAAQLLRDELLQRAELKIQINESSSADLSILLCDAESLPAEIQNQLDPPPKILPYPDYAEHYHVCLLNENENSTLVILAGAAKRLIYAIGYVLQQLLVYDDRIEFPEFNITRRPLNPLRGILFQGNLSDASIVRQQALWGDNCIGANHFDQSVFQVLNDSHIQSIQRSPFNRTTGNYTIDCIQANSSIKQSLEAIAQQAENKETWIDASTITEDQLDDLLLAPLGKVRALAHDPEHEMYHILQREMPLTMQLVALCRIDSATPSDLGKRRAEAAPLIYAALGASKQAPVWARLVWAALSWSPIPSLAEIFDSIGRCYLGAKAAQQMQHVLSQIESGNEFVSIIKEAEKNIPQRMKPLAAKWYE